MNSKNSLSAALYHEFCERWNSFAIKNWYIALFQNTVKSLELVMSYKVFIHSASAAAS